MRIRCAFIFLLMLLLFAVPASADFVLPADLTAIGEEAFANDESITGVLEIPEGVTSIGAGAFQGCGGILSVVIPEGITFIGETAFGECAEMTGYITGIETDEYLLDVTVRLMEGDKLIAETTTDQNGFYSLIARPGEYTLSATHADYEEKAVCVAILANESMQQDMDLHIAVSPVTDFTWRIVNSTEVAITGYTGSSAYMRIPEMINGMMVTTIGQGAFENNSIIKVVVMPDGITTIGSGAFQYCSNLMYTNIPINWTTVTKWEYTTGYIWRGCTKLLNITIPEGLVTVPAYAFWWCANIETVSFPSTLESIGYQAFSGNSNLTHVSFQDGLKVIGERAFEGCTKLQNVEFPNSLTTIGTFAFQGCKSFTHIRLPDSVTNIGRSAFAYCENLESCNIPPNWTTVGQVPGTIYYGLIWEGTKIHRMVVPEGVTKLPDYAFANCHNITAIDLPSTLQVIGGAAFYDCTGLNNIDIPDSVHTINGFAFDGCTGLSSITLPEGITTLSSGIFKNCSSISQFNLPSTITKIRDSAFEGCTSLYSFDVPDTVTSILRSAFKNCSNLGSITIPQTVDYIGNYAFEGCNSLSNFEWPETVTTIEGGTFLNCLNLRSITIPETVKRINYSAFQGCIELAGIEIPDSITILEYDTFKGCTNLTSITLPQSLTVIGNRVFANCTSLSGVLEIPDTVTSIGTAAFQNCTGLSGELDLPDSLVTIVNNAFENCTGLQGDLVIPDSVTTIGSSAFLNSGFDNAVVLSDSVSALSASVFGGMDISMFIGGTALTTIDDTAFENCESLTVVFLYNKIENADAAFTSGTQIFYWDENKKSFYLSSKPIVETETVVTRIDPHIAIDGDSCTYINNSTVELPINVELKPGLKIVNPYTEETLHTTLESPALYISVPYCCTMESELFAACEDEEHALVMLDEEDSPFESGISLMKLSGVKSGEDSVTAHIHCSHSDRPDHDIKHQIALQVIDANGVSSEWKEITVELFKQEAIEITHISGSSLYWPVLETDYEFEIGWQLNADPIENGGYNVYLFEKDAPEKCYKLNSDYVTDTTIRCSSAIFYEILGEIDFLTVYVRVEYVDTAKGEVVCTGVTGGTRYRTLCKKDWLQDYLTRLRWGCQYAVVLHDSFYYGEYQLGDQVYESGTGREIFSVAYLYKTVTGKLNKLQLDPIARGLLMATSVMSQVSSSKPEEPLLNSDVKKVMELAGFDVALIESAEEEMERVVDEAMLQVKDSLFYGRNSPERYEAFREYEKKLTNFQDVQILSKLFKRVHHIEDVLATIAEVFEEYNTYHTVTREDVQPYIDIFRESNSLELTHAATFLEIMTKDDASLISFLLFVRGNGLATDKLIEFGFENSITALNPYAALFIIGYDSIASIAFNVSNYLTAQIDLITTVNMVQEIRLKYENAYRKLVENPVYSYDEYMENVYLPFVELKDSMLDMTAVEYTKFATYCEAFTESKIIKLTVLVVSLIQGNGVPQERSVEDYMNEVEGCLEPALKDYYQIFVEPYSW